MTDIAMRPVASSNIAEIGYDMDSQTLGVRFQGGNLYYYKAVPEEEFEELASAASVGQHFLAHIKGRYLAFKATDDGMDISPTIAADTTRGWKP